MTRKARLGILILSVVLVATFIATTSLTFAKWNAGGGGGSTGESTTYGPVADSTNWSVYEKYFDYVTVTNGIAITGFTGVNIEDIIIPEKIDNLTVVAINSIFNTTQKSLPVTIKIPYTVTSISPAAFANLPNLQSLMFASYPSADDTPTVTEVGMYGFMNCQSLKEVVVYGNRKVNFGDYSFAGCVSLTTAPTVATTYLRFKDGTTDTTYYIAGDSSNITYSEDNIGAAGAYFTVS